MTGRLIAEPPISDVLHVASNLRPRDREELFATRYGENPETLAADIMRSGPFRWVAVAPDGEPVALVGAFPRWPNVWSAWSFGTPRWGETVGLVTRHVRRFMLPALYHSGATRVDCMALASHNDARKWLTFLGAEPKEVMDKWGKNGENFVNYVWTRENTKDVIDKIEKRQRS